MTAMMASETSGRLSAASVCTRDVAYVYRAMSVQEAAALMRERHVGALVVVDEKERGRVVVGMLTDRDIVTGVVAKGVDPAVLRIEDLMSIEPACAREHDSVIDLLGAMRREGVRRMPVVDARHVLVGLVALDDMIALIADELRLAAQAIESGRRREADTRR